jgi:hypothetical protein
MHHLPRISAERDHLFALAQALIPRPVNGPFVDLVCCAWRNRPDMLVADLIAFYRLRYCNQHHQEIVIRTGALTDALRKVIRPLVLAEQHETEPILTKPGIWQALMRRPPFLELRV